MHEQGAVSEQGGCLIRKVVSEQEGCAWNRRAVSEPRGSV